MNTNDDIIDLIIRQKNLLGLSLSQLSREVGMAKSAVSCYLNKTRDFPLNRIPQFAKALDLSEEELLGMPSENYPERFKQLDQERQEQVMAFLDDQKWKTRTCRLNYTLSRQSHSSRLD